MITEQSDEDKHQHQRKHIDPHQLREESLRIDFHLIGLYLFRQIDNEDINDEQQRCHPSPAAKEERCIRWLRTTGQHRQKQYRWEIGKRMHTLIQTRDGIHRQVHQIERQGQQDGTYRAVIMGVPA